ncbi:hypothetical protein O7543_11350 [Solwaraspora sp. WMMA2080]|uniref:hypothetical protein n=1 Tax=unclassified Solwaraspora TaxID=2627926 RepID=UPI00248CF325|nr:MULTISPECIES: hypothetical protein [unclassified Solwaraspora]WBB98476.1 hypothetical protein O7553_06015 [Solwaraspora sp. WMMA2059]WBC22971.1 hypothetical protein O7543_11350 [Solwaraspora sp. WMMA2080]
MLIQELLLEPLSSVPDIDPDVDPLQSPLLMQECQVLDIRIDVLRSTAAVLLEQRAAFDVLRGNTGIMVMRGVRSVHWHAVASVLGPLTAWVVVGATVALGSGGVKVVMGLSPDARLAGIAEVIEYYAVDANIGSRIPDYLEASGSEIGLTVATWESHAVPIERSSLHSVQH